MNIVKKAELFATVAHGAVGQKRKYSGADYIVHPISVKNILSDFGFSEDDNLLSGALLHDVVEDTDIKFELIEEVFNVDVANIVFDVTNPSKHYPDLNRKARKEMDLEHLKSAMVRSKALKLADLIHNFTSIVKEDPEFAKIWCVEAQKISDVCKDGSNDLYDEISYLLNTFFKSKP